MQVKVQPAHGYMVEVLCHPTGLYFFPFFFASTEGLFCLFPDANQSILTEDRPEVLCFLAAAEVFFFGENKRTLGEGDDCFFILDEKGGSR